jgi:hypothetical protein
VDLVVKKASAAGGLLARERQGEPVVLFDRGGPCMPPPLDRAAHDARIAARLALGAGGPRWPRAASRRRSRAARRHLGRDLPANLHAAVARLGDAADLEAPQRHHAEAAATFARFIDG